MDLLNLICKFRIQQSEKKLIFEYFNNNRGTLLGSITFELSNINQLFVSASKIKLNFEFEVIFN